MNNYSPLTLSQINGIIQSKLNDAFIMQYFWIVADITEHSFKEKNGCHYFQFVKKDVITNLIAAKMIGARSLGKRLKKLQKNILRWV